MPQYILILEAVLVPGLDGVLVVGKVKGDVYEYNPNINVHAFALNHVEAGLRVALLKAISDNYVIVACGGNAEVELGHTLKLLSGDARKEKLESIVARLDQYRSANGLFIEYVGGREKSPER